jgi:hypothetical protein
MTRDLFVSADVKCTDGQAGCERVKETKRRRKRKRKLGRGNGITERREVS